MSRPPHLYLPPPWAGEILPLDEGHRHHLFDVLRLLGGDPVTYTDGRGTLGTGVLRADGGVERGEERQHPAPAPRLTVAVAPPHRRRRRRLVVEKLAELGVDRLIWLDTARGEGRVPADKKAGAWAIGALEQSRGVWLTEVSGPLEPAGLSRPLWVADLGGIDPPATSTDLTVAVGPEGGWEPGEVPEDALVVGLGPRVLRVETAALAAAVLAFDRLSRHGKW